MSIHDVLSGTWRPAAYTAIGCDDVAPGCARGASRGARRRAAWRGHVGQRRRPWRALERDHRPARAGVHRLELGAALLRVLGGGKGVTGGGYVEPR